MNNTIDMEVVQELLDICDDGDTSLITDLIEMFLADGRERVNQVQTGIANADLETVERAAHSLKGSAGNLGATELMNIAEDMQNASRGGDAERVQELGPLMATQYDAAAEALSALRSRFGG